MRNAHHRDFRALSPRITAKAHTRGIRGSTRDSFKNLLLLAIECAVLISPLRAQFAYVTNVGDDTVGVYSISSTGALTAISGSPFATGTSPVAVAAIPTTRFTLQNRLQGWSDRRSRISICSGKHSHRSDCYPKDEAVIFERGFRLEPSILFWLCRHASDHLLRRQTRYPAR